MRKAFWKLAGALATVAAGAGCVCVGPDYERPEVPVPESWSAPAAEALEAAEGGSPEMASWWSVFGDEALESLLLDVRTNNCTLAAALARQEALEARYGASRGALWPSLDVQGGVAVDRQSEWVHNVGSEMPDNPGGLYSAGVSMGWELDLWGRVRRSVEAAKGQMEAGAEDVRDLLVSLQAEAASGYVSLRTCQRRLACAAANIRLQEEALQLAKDRYEAGLTGELDVRQAEMNLAATRASVPLAEAALESTLDELCVLAGRRPGELDGLRAAGAIPSATALPGLVPADVLRRRPDVRRAERELAAQTAAIGVAAGELYPKFSLNGSFSFSATDAGEFFSAEAMGYNVGPGVRWSIFSAGRIRNQVKAEEAGARAALAAYEGTVLGALGECEGALAGLAKSRARVAHLEAAVEAARRSVELAQELYRSGLTDFQNVLDMQRQLSANEDDLAESEGAVANGLVAVYKAFGGGW